MSKPVNPMAIGGFTVAALALLVAGLLIFGGGHLFDADKLRLVIFFNTSLNGLEIGAPVKMQGVKIGTVSEIKLEFDSDTAKVYKAVVVDIDRRGFAEIDGRTFVITNNRKRQQETLDRLVKEGFRARLEMQSLLTGLLYVDFGLYPDKPALFTGLGYQGLMEMPSIRPTTDDLRNTAEDLAEKLRALPIDKIAADISGTLGEIRKLLASEEMQRSNAALAKTLEGMAQTMATLNRNLEPLLRESQATVTAAHALAQDSRSTVNDARQQVKPVLAGAERALTTADRALADADKAMQAATAALDRAQSTLVTVDGAVGPDSTLNETLVAMRDAARSLKSLTDYLERHPEAVISGKDH